MLTFLQRQTDPSWFNKANARHLFLESKRSLNVNYSSTFKINIVNLH